MPVPVFKTKMPFIDLNDRNSWAALGLKIDNGHIQNAASQFAWRAKGVWTSQDFVGRKIHIPAHYYEAFNNVPFPAVKAMLTQSGEQYLTFDGVTGMRVRCNSFAEFDPLDGFPEQPRTSGSVASYAWAGTLEFLSRNPFAEDMVPLTTDQFTMTTGGAHAILNVSYGGHAFASPYFTIYMSGSNLSGIFIRNNMSGEQLTILPNLSVGMPPGTNPYPVGNHTIVIDSDLSSVVMDGTVNLPPQGSFPMIYPDVAQDGSTFNQFEIWCSNTTGTTNITGTMTYTSKYEF